MDQWDSEAEQSQKKYNDESLRMSSLIYQVFCTEAGERLLADWTEKLIQTPSYTPGLDSISIGMNEGEKRFMRSIINVMKTHEDSQ